MKGLKSVYGLVDKSNGVTPTDTAAVGMALVDGLRENTKLQKIFHDSGDRCWIPIAIIT
jgi:hypothetical protein